MRFKTVLIAGVSALALTYSFSALAVSTHFKPVALSGAALPGVPDPGFSNPTFHSFASASQGGGVTAFQALSVDDSNTRFIDGVFRTNGSGLERLASVNELGPGELTDRFLTFDFFDGVAQGRTRTAFFATLNDFEQSSESGPGGIFADSGAGLQLIALEEDLPSLSGDTVAFSGRSGVFRDNGGDLETVAGVGDNAPGTDGTAFTRFGSVAQGGRTTAFLAETDPEPGTTNDRGVFRESGSGVELVAFEGDTAPDAGGAIFAEFNNLSQSGSTTAFLAQTSAEPGTSNDQGIFRDSGSGLELVAFEGDTAPGTDGETFRAFLDGPAQGGDTTGFIGVTTSQAGVPNQSGVFQDDGTGLDLVALAGDAAPGTSEVFTAFQNVAVNNLGRVVFEGLFGNGLDGLFTINNDGDLISILVAGQTLTVAENDTRTVSSLDFNPLAGLDGDTLAFIAGFTDGSSGVFKVHDISAIPVPASLPLLLSALGFFGLVKIRHRQPS